ncbi:MAG: hypothetical protein FWG64_06805 [Firmicutes bacterium]|nr:hypothetical protein [Bacillota bacterium]
MFSEVIYTRCRKGIDLLTGNPLTQDGFKVYNVSNMSNLANAVDLPFLINAAQAKQTYSDPDFMDDAYLYYTPDKGLPFMVNFYPVPFEAVIKGDYSHRPGNFINQIFVGDFSEIYPSELFGNIAWDAKTCGEAHYYEVSPAELPQRKIATKSKFAEISAFISAGRAKALSYAVAFLIEQFSAENRKFLTIIDTTSNIENWITAIQYAFSPRIAAAVSFATRLDKFTNNNVYTVNQNGTYQSQINLQDKNQSGRFRAMIIGVNELDKNNINSAKVMQNSQFAVLDGREKMAMFDVDISHKYFSLISTFDENHEKFCREFLQMVDLKKPTADLLRLHEVFEIWQSKTFDTAKMLKIANVLDKYTLFTSNGLSNLYNRTITQLSEFFQQDFSATLEIVKWLKKIAKILEDTNFSQKSIEVVCKTFADHIFSKSDTISIFEFWRKLKTTEFATATANYVTSDKILVDYSDSHKKFELDNAVSFVLIFLECANFTKTVKVDEVQKMVNYGLHFCYKENSKSSAQKIIKYLKNTEIILKIAENASESYAEFLSLLLLENFADFGQFLQLLPKYNLEFLYPQIIKSKVKTFNRFGGLQNQSNDAEIERFIAQISKIKLAESHLIEIFEELDTKLSMANSGQNVVVAMQTKKPKSAKCPKSAHLYALLLFNNRKDNRIFDNFKNLAKQDFPSEKNPNYIAKLTSNICETQFSKEEFFYILDMFSEPKEYLKDLTTKIFATATAKNKNNWNFLIEFAVQESSKNPKISEVISQAITEECTKLKGEKAMQKFESLLNFSQGKTYFKKISETATAAINENKPKSAIGRLFGRGKK